MKRFSLITIAALMFGSLAGPSFNAQEATLEIDLDARKASVVNLEAHINSRRDRMQETADDIIVLDQRVEGGVSELVELLTRVADSPDSKTSIANTKGEMIEGLKRMIDFYRTKRAGVREQVRTGKTDVPLETLENDMTAFDKRIETRVEQIVDLSASFTQHEDFEKYVKTGEVNTWGGWGSWGGWGVNEEVNDEWRQNRRDVSKTGQNNDEVSAALAKSIDDLDQRQKFLEEKLRTGNISETEKQLYQSDIKRIDYIVMARTEQLNKLQVVEIPETEKVGRREAYDLGKLLEDAKDDLRSDFFMIFQKYEELNKLRAQVAQLSENLEARKTWLIDYEAGGGQ